jgi:hypothetical protein
MVKRQGTTTPGEMTFLWLDGVRVKPHHWIVGTVRHRNKYQAWANYLLTGLKNAEFLVQVESQTDPWSKAKTVGQKISELAATYRELPEETKAQLAQETEVELKTGMQLLNADKKQLLELVATAADP